VFAVANTCARAPSKIPRPHKSSVSGTYSPPLKEFVLQLVFNFNTELTHKGLRGKSRSPTTLYFIDPLSSLQEKIIVAS
jgi:hypothetical protein